MQQGWPCRVFGPGLAPAGEAAELRVVGEVIVVHLQGTAPGDGSYQVAAAGVSLRRVGLDERGVELAWREPGKAGDESPGGLIACHVLDADPAQAVLDALPASARSDLRVVNEYDQRQRLKRRIGLSVIGLVIVLPLLLVLLALVTLDSIAGFVVERIPVEQEQAIARRYAEEFGRNGDMRRDGLRHRTARAIVDRLSAPGTAYDYTVFVAADEAVNAFAMPGGVIVVNDGLFDASRSPEELAGVLAHEMQHVELRHGLRGLVKQMGLSVFIVLLTGDLNGSLAGELGGRLAGLKFSRDAEMQADTTGFERLVAADIDPAGMAKFFELLAAKGGGSVELLSTHPDSRRRAASLRALTSAAAGVRSFTPLLEVLAQDTGLQQRWPPPVSPE